MKQLKQGWYIVSHQSGLMSNAIVFLQDKSITHTFGFNHRGEWTDIYNNQNLYGCYFRDIVRPATNEKIQTALTEEAIRRGVWDVPIRSAVTKGISSSASYEVCYDYVNNVLWSRYGRVFDNSEWATAVELTTEQRLERIEKHLGLWNQ